MLASALRRNAGDSALDNLEQCLLYTLTGYIARDGRILALAGNLVDLVDVDDAALRRLNVVIGILNQAQEDVLDILADITRLGEAGRVCDGERHIENLSERLREERLAASGRTDHHDVALL